LLVIAAEQVRDRPDGARELGEILGHVIAGYVGFVVVEFVFCPIFLSNWGAKSRGRHGS
jgi:hypothetical protein